MAGQIPEAEAILACAEAIAGELGLFAEEVKPARKGSSAPRPSFAQIAYVRAVLWTWHRPYPAEADAR